MKPAIILLLLICLSPRLFPQKSRTDSLIGKLRYVRQDTIKARLYIEIGQACDKKKSDSAIHWFNKAITTLNHFHPDSASKIINLPVPDFSSFSGKELKYAMDRWLLCAQALRSDGNTFRGSGGKYDTSYTITDKAIKIYSGLLNVADNNYKNKTLLGLSGCYNNTGLLFSDRGNDAFALGYYEKSIKISRELSGSEDKNISLKAKKGLSDSYTNVGLVYYFQGKYPKAIEYFQKSLKIDEKLGDKQGMSYCYVNTGLIHKDQGNYPQAIAYYQKALKIFLETDDKKGIRSSYNNIGIIYHKQGNLSQSENNNMAAENDYKNAIEYFQKAITINEEINDKKGMSNCFNNIGLVYYSRKNYFMTLEFFQKALKIYREIGDKNGIALVLGNIAELNLTLAGSTAKSPAEKNKFYHEAISNGILALSLAKEIKAMPWQNSASQNLYKAYKALGNTTKALEYAEFFISTKDSMFRKEKTKAIAEMETKYQAEKKQLEIDKLEKEKELQASDMKKQKLIIWFVVSGLAFMAIFLVIVLRLFLQKKKANKIITEKNEEIIIQRDNIQKQKELIETHQKEIEDSINYAKYIQEAVMPSEFHLKDIILSSGYKNPEGIFILFKPKDIVSGDFYWFSRVNEWLVVAVADCTGHGVPGAFMSMLGISFLNELVRKKEITRSSEILNQLRLLVIDALKQKGTDPDAITLKDGMDIALCAINLNTLKMQFAGANNPCWIVETYQGMSQQLTELRPDKMPIGIHENMKPFTNHDFQLHKGDTIYLMSDGFEDQFGGPNHKKFFAKNLKNLLLANCQLPMTNQKQILETTLTEWIGTGEQIDDITVLGIKI